jgi:hypothetical protein
MRVAQDVSRPSSSRARTNCSLDPESGHNIAGNAVCDDGLMIDLSLMKTSSRPVPPGDGRSCSLLADFDAAARHMDSRRLWASLDQGVAGLTLGGGFGWLSRNAA